MAKSVASTMGNRITATAVHQLDHTVVNAPHVSFKPFDSSGLPLCEILQHVLWHGDVELAQS